MIDERLTWLDQVQIRYLKENDLPALEWDGEYKHFRRMYNHIYRDVRDGKALMWVADLEGVGIIGQLFVQLASSRRELADGLTQAYIYAFRVKSTYRGQGLGTRLLEVVEADLAARRFRWVNLNVSRDNQVARLFYERCGYSKVAADPGRWSYVDDLGRQRWVHEPAWRMRKEIS